MPQLPRLITSSMQTFADRLRFVPAGVAQRQLEHVEELILELLMDFDTDSTRADRLYPVRWVLTRITGHAKLAQTDDTDDSQIIGRALLADLAAVAEHLSDGAHLNAAAHLAKPEYWLTSEQLQKRWNVSRRTLSRLRREGLASRRIFQPRKPDTTSRSHAGSRLGRVVYWCRIVEMFDARFIQGKSSLSLPTNHRAADLNYSKLRGGKRQAIPAESLDRVIALAFEIAGRGGSTMAAACRSIGKQTGLSPERVRRAIRAYEREQGGNVAIISAAKELPSAARKRTLAQRVLRGESVGLLQRETGLSRASLYRLAALDRLARLRTIHWPTDLQSPIFDRKDAYEVLLAPISVRQGLGQPWPTNLHDLLLQADHLAAPSAQVESERAVAHLYLIWWARQQIADLTHRHHDKASRRLSTPPRLATALAEIETALTWAARLKTELIRSQLGLILRSIASQTQLDIAANFKSAAPPTQWESRSIEPIALCLHATSLCVDLFDPFKGGRLAAAVAISLGKVLGQRSQTHQTHATGHAEKRLHTSALRIDDYARLAHSWQPWLEPPNWVRDRVMEMEEGTLARQVMCLRWCWADKTTGAAGATQPPLTPAHVSRLLGLSLQRVRMLEKKIVSMEPGQSARTPHQ